MPKVKVCPRDGSTDRIKDGRGTKCRECVKKRNKAAHWRRHPLRMHGPSLPPWLKRCSGDCKRSLAKALFSGNRAIKDGLSTVCKACAKLWVQNKMATPEARAARTVYDRNRKARIDPARRLYSLVKSRAKVEGIPFDLDLADIDVPTHCPVLGIPLVRGGRVTNEGNPSVDRLVPGKGYVKGNVWVISLRANKLKNDATPAELRRIADAVEARMRHSSLPSSPDGSSSPSSGEGSSSSPSSSETIGIATHRQLIAAPGRHGLPSTSASGGSS